jgi:hypothetical protein
VQIRAPKGTFSGEFENRVILTDQDGKPIAGAPKHSRMATRLPHRAITVGPRIIGI